MNFTEFTQQAMPYINFLIGIGIALVIRLKNSEINALKTNVSVLESIVKHNSIDEAIKNTNLKIENLNLEHKKEIESVFKRSEENVKEKILELASPWLVKYQELLNYQFHSLLKMSDEELENFYKLLPENKEFIQYQIKNIKETGDIKDLPKN